MTVTDRVRTLLIDEIGVNVPASELTDDLPIVELRLIDSLGIFRIVEFVEQEYGLVIPDEELHAGNFESIAAIAAMIESLGPERS